MRFSMKEPGLSSLVAEILYTNEEEKHFLSHDMERTSESIIHWLERRIIPKSRTFPDKILKAPTSLIFPEFWLWFPIPAQAFTTSPEPTTGGILPKACAMRGRIGFVSTKAELSAHLILGVGPYNEHYASQVSEPCD